MKSQARLMCGRWLPLSCIAGQETSRTATREMTCKWRFACIRAPHRRSSAKPGRCLSQCERCCTPASALTQHSGPQLRTCYSTLRACATTLPVNVRCRLMHASSRAAHNFGCACAKCSHVCCWLQPSTASMMAVSAFLTCQPELALCNLTMLLLSALLTLITNHADY